MNRLGIICLLVVASQASANAQTSPRDTLREHFVFASQPNLGLSRGWSHNSSYVILRWAIDDDEKNRLELITDQREKLGRRLSDSSQKSNFQDEKAAISDLDERQRQELEHFIFAVDGAYSLRRTWWRKRLNFTVQQQEQIEAIIHDIVTKWVGPLNSSLFVSNPEPLAAAMQSCKINVIVALRILDVLTNEQLVILGKELESIYTKSETYISFMKQKFNPEFGLGGKPE